MSIFGCEIKLEGWSGVKKKNPFLERDGKCKLTRVKHVKKFSR